MESQVEIIQINIAGKDQPGLTSSLTDILARYDAFILDIGQANIHQSLTLGILIKTTSDKSGAIMKELLFKSSELGINIRFTPISEERYTAWVGMQGKNRYIITLLGRQLTARHIADVAGVISRQGLNIDAIKRMTGRVPLHEDERAPKSCIEFSVRGSLTEEATTAIQEQVIRPLRAHNNVQVIRGKSSERMVFTLPKFTIPDDKHLVVELYEKEGGRHQTFTVENADLVRAEVINELKVK